MGEERQAGSAGQLSVQRRCRSAARILGTSQKRPIRSLLGRHDAAPASRTLLSRLGEYLVGAVASGFSRHQIRIAGVTLVVALPQAAAGKEFAVPPLALDQDAAFALWTRFGDDASDRFEGARLALRPLPDDPQPIDSPWPCKSISIVVCERSLISSNTCIRSGNEVVSDG